MKTRLLSLLALGAVACQQHSPATTQAATPAAASSSPEPRVAAEARGAAPATPFDTQSVTFFRRYNLSRLLQNAGPPLRRDLTAIPVDQVNQVRAMNGFYGPDKYRLEVALLEMKRDPKHPNHYWVQGKERYKGVITPLVGFITLTQVKAKEPRQANTSDLDGEYAILGTYELREDSTKQDAGVFRGKVAIDMQIYEDEVQLVDESDIHLKDKIVSQGGIVTFDGTWTSSATQQQKAATWVANLIGYHGAQVASDFIIGARHMGINPKYAHLGWENYWENEEWWAESPKNPSLGL